MPAKKVRLTPRMKKMLTALFDNMGNVTLASKITGIDRKTHYNWLESNEKYAEAYEEMTDVQLDFAEMCLFNNMKNGKEASAIFYLKTKGAKRGYYEPLREKQQQVVEDIRVDFFVEGERTDEDIDQLFIEAERDIDGD